VARFGFLFGCGFLSGFGFRFIFFLRPRQGFARLFAFFRGRFAIDEFFQFRLGRFRAARFGFAAFPPDLPHQFSKAAAHRRRRGRRRAFAARAAGQQARAEDREGHGGAHAAATSGHGYRFGANRPPLEHQLRASDYRASSASSAASSSTGTPRRSAFSSFDPGLSPATT
jgi:hypothetical protein